MIVFTNFNVGVLSDKTLIRDLAHVILAHDHFGRDAAGRAPITKQMFARMVKRYRPNLREFQKTVDGAEQWMYGGVGLRNENSNHSISDIRSRVKQGDA